MKKPSIREKLLLEDISKAANTLQYAMRGLSIGELVKLIRNQLKMSQGILAKRAGVPQSTISRVEKNMQEPALSTLTKILKALSCELVIAPMLKESIDDIRQKQAKRLAEKHVKYLRGTMSLEKQEPDSRLLKELIEKEKEELLQQSGTRLWKE